MKPWLVINASPRYMGRCEKAACLAAYALREKKIAAEAVFLRKYSFSSCMACGFCNTKPDTCVLDEEFSKKKDQAAFLLKKLRAATGLIIISPIYFYGLPAHMKALIDRSQRYWNLQKTNKNKKKTAKPACALLLAGRKEGERLFDGALLSLRPFLHLHGFELIRQISLRGMDFCKEMSFEKELATHVNELTELLAEITQKKENVCTKTNLVNIPAY